MIQEDVYKIKFDKLQPWILEIFQAIRKEIKNDHMRNHPEFVRKHFQKKDPAKATAEELSFASLAEVNEGNEEFGEWLVSRWVVKNSDLYQFFASELSKINPEFDQIDMIPDPLADQMIRYSVAQFGAGKVYIFAVFNSVRFSEAMYQNLKAAAEAELKVQSVVEEKGGLSLEDLKKQYEGLIEKLTNKYEKRLQGLERKYFDDVEGLKKQISQLHKKIAGKGV